MGSHFLLMVPPKMRLPGFELRDGWQSRAGNPKWRETVIPLDCPPSHGWLLSCPTLAPRHWHDGFLCWFCREAEEWVKRGEDRQSTRHVEFYNGSKKSENSPYPWPQLIPRNHVQEHRRCAPEFGSGSHHLPPQQISLQHLQVVHINLHYIVSCCSLDRLTQKQPSLCPLLTPEPTRRLKVGQNVSGILRVLCGLYRWCSVTFTIFTSSCVDKPGWAGFAFASTVSQASKVLLLQHERVGKAIPIVDFVGEGQARGKNI